MYNVLSRFYNRHFTNPESVVLALFLAIGLGLLIAFGHMLASVLAALVIAFVLEWVIKQVEALHVPRPYAIALVYVGFLSLLIFSLFGLIPLLWQQTTHLIEELPRMFSEGQQQLLLLPMHYPELFSEAQVKEFIAIVHVQLGQLGQHLFSYSVEFVPVIAAIVVYFFLLPLMVFFMLKDKTAITQWVTHFLPKERGLVERVWDEVYMQLGNYVRGKVGEVFIVGITSCILFVFLGLHYAILMGVLVGVSVLVPYVGATVVTIPIVLIAFFQWGWDAQFFYLILAYGLLQAIDGNVLVPLLFSEVVNLHPLAIIIAVIFFGALWGFWGVFFAIPLAVLIKAVINAWPEPKEEAL